MTQTIRNDPDSPSFNEPILHGLTEAEFVRDILSTEAFNPGLQQQLQGFETRILKRHLRKVIIDNTLRFNGFGEDSRLRVPSPIIYIPALSFLMMEQAEGELLRAILERGSDPDPYVKGAAQWLARLHSCNITLGGASSRDDEIANSHRYMRAASWLLPTLKSEIKSISDQLIGAQKSLHLHTKKPIHGDYHPRNIIVSPGLTTVIDFEETRMGDPAFDVGYFTAQTKMTHGLGDTTLQAVEAFVQEYRENMP